MVTLPSQIPMDTVHLTTPENIEYSIHWCRWRFASFRSQGAALRLGKSNFKSEVYMHIQSVFVVFVGVGHLKRAERYVPPWLDADFLPFRIRSLRSIHIGVYDGSINDGVGVAMNRVVQCGWCANLSTWYHSVLPYIQYRVALIPDTYSIAKTAP